MYLKNKYLNGNEERWQVDIYSVFIIIPSSVIMHDNSCKSQCLRNAMIISQNYICVSINSPQCYLKPSSLGIML